MKTFVVRVAVAAAALVVAASMAVADGETLRNRKKGLFYELFGDGPQFRKLPRRQTNYEWWDDDGGIRFFSDTPRRKNYSLAEVDGDVDPGFGMGNLTYVPDKLVSLAQVKLAQPRPPEASAAAIYDALTDPDLAIRIEDEERQAILDHYAATGFRPVWIDGGKLAPRAEAVLALFAAAGDEGLEPANYQPPSMAGFDAASRPIPGDMPALARLDLGLTAMAVKYARHASGGQFDPRRLSRYHDITPETVSATQAVKVLAFSPFPDAYLRDLQPRHPVYAAMKSALSELRRELAGREFVPVPEGKRVKPGKSDARIVALRARLHDMALLPPEALLDAGSETLDAAVSAALKRFQKQAKIKPTGTLDGATVAALNDHGSDRDLRRLTYNMERMRWLPKNLGSKFVFVNTAAFQVSVMERGSEIWRSKVIVGKPMNQTSAFHDEIETVVFNPSWGVPPSIIANEYLPKLWEDPSYLDREGFRVIDSSGEVIPSSYIDWNAYSGRVPFDIEQPPGDGNALGQLKFLFPNKHNIYMHDTPTKKLFAKDERAYSHGCVRVQNPREYAMVLLGWSRVKVDQNTDSGVSHTVKLPAKVPVHLTYFTAWPDENGKILYFNDIYGRDQTMEKALSAQTLALR
ncbi:MAG: L,D-transpeptidase family protein [Hyphomicrobiales bacterium]